MQRYEHIHPRNLVHVDIKKLGRIPDGGGHRVLDRAAGRRTTGAGVPGCASLLNVVDDLSWLASIEIYIDNQRPTAAGL